MRIFIKTLMRLRKFRQPSLDQAPSLGKTHTPHKITYITHTESCRLEANDFPRNKPENLQTMMTSANLLTIF